MGTHSCNALPSHIENISLWHCGYGFLIGCLRVSGLVFSPLVISGYGFFGLSLPPLPARLSSHLLASLNLALANCCLRVQLLSALTQVVALKNTNKLAQTYLWSVLQDFPSMLGNKPSGKDVGDLVHTHQQSHPSFVFFHEMIQYPLEEAALVVVWLLELLYSK